MIEARTSRIALMTEPQTGPKSTPFMIASASVTENGAEATIANTITASGIAKGPSWMSACSTHGRCETTKAASANEATKIPTASRRRNQRPVRELTALFLGGRAVFAFARPALSTGRASRSHLAYWVAELGD